MSKAEEAALKKRILKRFPQADKDGDGVLSNKEWQAVIRQAGVTKGEVYVYKQVDGVNREMEIYFPKGHDASKKTVPGIILFHGGGWGGGSRVAFADQCNEFASRGMVAATVTYRLRTKEDQALLTEGQSTKRVCIPDVKSAIRWFKQNAEELGVDPNRIVAGGGSAGGHISLLGTTNPGLNDPGDPKGIDTSVAAYVLFNPALSQSNAKDPDVDFLQHLKADFGPAIVFFGSEDKWLKNGWTPAAAKMKSLGITSVEMQIAEGQTHAFFNRQPWKDLTLIAADQFLTKLGYLKGKPTLSMPETGETLTSWGQKSRTNTLTDEFRGSVVNGGPILARDRGQLDRRWRKSVPKRSRCAAGTQPVSPRSMWGTQKKTGRAKPRVDTIEANHQGAQSFRSQH